MNLKQRYLFSALAALVLFVYYPAIFSPICLLDDGDLLINLTSRHYNLSAIFLPKAVGYYRPLLDLIYYVEDRVWMLEPSFLHLDNVIFHVVNVFLVYVVALLISKLLYGRKSKGIAFSAAVLFALHPINTEPVDWISGRTDLLSGNFLLLSVFLLFKSLERNSLRLLSIAAVSMFISCLAKETPLFAYPGFMFFIYVYDLHAGSNPAAGRNEVVIFGSVIEGLKTRLKFFLGSFKSRKYYYLIITMVPIAYFLLRKLAATASDGSVNRMVKSITSDGKGVSFSNIILESLKAMGFYLKKIFCPWPLNFDIAQVSDLYILLGFALVGLLVWLFWKQSLVSALFVCSICIASSAIFVALGRFAWTLYAERYMYIPSALFAIGTVCVINDLFRRHSFEKARFSFALLLLGILTITTVQRNFIWMDEVKLYEDSVSKSPNFYRGWRNYVLALYRAGEYKKARDVKKIVLKLMNHKNNSELKGTFSSGIEK
ncbi:MAG TPA: hypothetical protein VMT12_05555 [Syntrophales bacterium]|nr:hypothetical protein [Syntrophales bacterium]